MAECRWRVVRWSLPACTTALSLVDDRILTSVVTPRAVNSTESASTITRDSTMIYTSMHTPTTRQMIYEHTHTHTHTHTSTTRLHRRAAQYPQHAILSHRWKEIGEETEIKKKNMKGELGKKEDECKVKKDDAIMTKTWIFGANVPTSICQSGSNLACESTLVIFAYYQIPSGMVYSFTLEEQTTWQNTAVLTNFVKQSISIHPLCWSWQNLARESIPIISAYMPHFVWIGWFCCP